MTAPSPTSECEACNDPFNDGIHEYVSMRLKSFPHVRDLHAALAELRGKLTDREKQVEAVLRLFNDYINGRLYDELCKVQGGPSGYVSDYCFGKVRRALEPKP